MNLRDPLAKVRGLGSARSGSQHWWLQRLTAVALALLTPWFIWTAVCLLGADEASARAALAQPLTATLMMVFVLAAFWHIKLGLQVVVEDYIHVAWQEWTLQIVILFACALAAMASVVAIGRIAFAG